MDQTVRARLGIGLLAAACAIHALAYVFAQSQHVFDPAWPMHARFHTLQGLSWIVGLNLTLLAIVVGPLRRGQHWPLLPLLIGGFGAHASYFAAIALFPEGRPPEMSAHLALAVVMAAYFIGLWLVYRAARGTPQHS